MTEEVSCVIDSIGVFQAFCLIERLIGQTKETEKGGALLGAQGCADADGDTARLKCLPQKMIQHGCRRRAAGGLGKQNNELIPAPPAYHRCAGKHMAQGLGEALQDIIS